MPRKASNATPDILELLKQDHQAILALFDEFDKKQKRGEFDDEAKQALVDRACAELSLHSQIEEEMFYPALRDALGDLPALDQANVEHEIADQAINALEAMDPDEDFYDARFVVLGEYIRHHIDAEQEQVFALAKKSRIDLAEMGTQFLERKEELRHDFGLSEEEDEDARQLSSRQVAENGAKRPGRSART